MLVWTDLKLWPHQRNAVEKLDKYITSPSTKSFLVHMPTGSGKTGIIATVARFILKGESKLLLVLTPRISLRNQAYSEINSNFFDVKLKLKDDPKLSSILALSDVVNCESATSIPLNINKRLVLVSTVQLINTIENSDDANDKVIMDFLQRNTDVLIVDEGHYEPAISWSKTIRGLANKRILFTATPYRNDFRNFDFGKELFSYSYNFALKDKYLRNVEFVHPNNQLNHDPIDVIDAVDDVLANQLKDFPNAKAIIRCDTEEQVKSIGEAIIQKHKDKDCLIGFHENFQIIEEWKRRHVPDPETMKGMKQRYWVHQFKLLEGVDNPDFMILAIHDNLGNERAIIQQIGRIIRNPKQKLNAKAYVIDFFNKKLENTWKRFRNFDSRLQGDDKDWMFLLGSPTERLNDAIREKFTSTEYLFNKYRDKYEDDSFVALNDLTVPLRVNFLRKRDTFDLTTFTKAIEDRFGQNDYQYKQSTYLADKFIVYYYRVASNSEFLDDKYSFILKDGVIIIYDIDTDMMAFLDTGGLLPQHEAEKFGLHEYYSRKSLQKIFNKGQKSSIKRLTANGMNASIDAVSGIAIEANSVERTPPFMENQSQVIGTLSGSFVSGTKVDKKGNVKDILTHRYVGFANARLSQSGQPVTIDKYKEWVDDIITLMSGQSQPVELYKRFNDTIERAIDTKPKFVQFNSQALTGHFYTVANEEYGLEAGSDIDIDAQPAAVIKKGEQFQFKILANGIDFYASIVFEKNKYIINCPDLSSLYSKTGMDQYKGVIDYFNATQDFKVIPKQSSIIYHQGNFVSTAVKFGAHFDINSFHVGKIIHAFEHVTSSEKGTCRVDKTAWTKGSLFEFLDNYVRNPKTAHQLYEVVGKPDYVVCDDANNEICDFILAWENPRKVAMVHAKYKEGQISTKNLEGVCRQAVTNARFLNLYLSDDIPTLDNWTKPYKMEGVGSLKTRIRKTKHGKGPTATWNVIKTIINHPASQREVWLLLGNMLDKEELIKQLKRPAPSEFAINTVQFLTGTMQNIGNVVATLKVLAVNDPKQ